MSPTEPKPKRSFWWSLRGFFAALGALLTTTVAVVGLFLPQDQPPVQATAAGPTAMGGEISDVQDSSDGACCTFSVQVELAGLNGRDCVLTTVVIDALDGSQTPVPGDLVFTPEADIDRARADVEVPVAAAGTYSVRFILSDPDGVELDRDETEQFDVG